MAVVFPFVTNNIINTQDMRDGDFNGLAKTQALALHAAHQQHLQQLYAHFLNISFFF